MDTQLTVQDARQEHHAGTIDIHNYLTVAAGQQHAFQAGKSTIEPNVENHGSEGLHAWMRVYRPLSNQALVLTWTELRNLLRTSLGSVRTLETLLRNPN